MLTSERVSTIFHDCLAQNADYDRETHTVIEGIVNAFALNNEKIAAYSNEIEGMLDELPTEFHIDQGGGMSFLNMCMDRHGNQWTGMHQVCQELLVLGLAIEKVSFPLPRDVWSALPGGVPYITVLSKKNPRRDW